MNCIFNRYRKNKEEILTYTAYLQCLPDNSRFIYRIQRVQTELLVAFQKDESIDLERLENILNNGFIFQSDAPQENLFVDSVHPAVSESKRVFSGLFLDDVELLTTILTSACLKTRVNPSIFNVSLFLLECSDFICKRFGYCAYENGNPNSETPNLSSLADFDANKNKIMLMANEIQELCDKYNVSEHDFNRLTLSANSKKIQKELDYYGYAPIVENQPFYHCSNNNFIVLSPSYLLHAACREAINTMTKLHGKMFFEHLIHFVNEEAGAILQRAMGRCFESDVLDGIPYMLFQFDSDKAVVLITALSSNTGISNVQKKLEEKIKNKHSNGKTFHILIYIPLDDSVVGLIPTEHCVCLKLDELRMLSCHHQFSLMNLFYYSIDREEQSFTPLCTDKDKLAFYFHENCTFYRDEKPSVYWVYSDFAQVLKYEHAIKNKIHDIAMPNGMGYLRISHYADIPTGVPIYAPYLYNKCDFLICELTNARLFVVGGVDNKYNAIHRELIICLMNWFYAIEYKYHIQLFNTDWVLSVDVCENGVIEVQRRGIRACVINVALKCFEDIEVTGIEPMFVKECSRQLIGFNIMNPIVTEGMLDEMFGEVGCGRFLQIGYNSDPRTIKDKYTTIYELSERWADKILAEIAEHVNRKGHEIKLSKEEGRTLLTDVISFLQQEAIELIKQFDTNFLVERLLQLYHSLIYWSAISNARFQGLSRAYEYIDAVFENQQKFINGYVEMKTLSQGIVEYIFMQSVLANKKEKGTEEMIDRLFALMHHIVDFGSCLDSLMKNVKGAEIVLLPNGRVVYPRPAINISNKYFEHLRFLMMVHPDKIQKLHNEIPDYSVDTSSNAFDSSFIAEFGFSYQKFTLVIQKSIEYSDRINEPVVKIEEDVFKREVIAEVLNAEEYKFFKKNLVLSSEQNTSALSSRDFFIQRFNRETQFSTRPWILLNDKILYSTKIIAESVKIFHDRLSYGIYRGNSPQMKKFIQGTIDEKGKNFNKRLYDFYTSLNTPNLLLYSEEKIKPGARLAGPKDIGDIDLILIRTDTKQIVCLEAKNYYEARDVYSLVDQNVNTEKHLKKTERRDKWCKENVLQFKKVCSSVDESYSIKTVFLTYNEPAYRYFEHEEKTYIPLLSALEIIDTPMLIFE